MSSQTPPTLLELAGQSLLMDKPRAILALEDLPTQLFPPLFMEAFRRGHTEVLKKMVQAWPFPCLPLGALMRQPQLEMTRVALEGLELLLVQQHRPRWKLQVLDLRNVHQNFWRTWSGAVVDACSPEVTRKRQTVTAPAGTEPTLPLKVFLDLCFQQRPLNGLLAFLFHRVEERHGSLQLCCGKLQMCSLPIHSIKRILEKLDLDFIQQVEVQCYWKLSTLASFATYLGQMKNLRKLLFPHVTASAYASQEEKDELMDQFVSQFATMNSLWRPYLDGVFLLDGYLCQVLRHLKTPLETLSITNCQLSDVDWSDLSGSPNLHQLKHLKLSGIKLTNFSAEPFNFLLDNAAATLETLNLQDCEITDPQLQAILPALSRCSQLRMLSFHENCLYMSVLRALLCHTARLSYLSLEMYPATLEIYDAQGALQPGRFFQFYDELMGTLRDMWEPKKVSFHTKPCHLCGNRLVYNLPSSLCRCWLPA